MPNRSIRDTEEAEGNAFASLSETDESFFRRPTGHYPLAIPPGICLPYARLLGFPVLGCTPQFRCEFPRFGLWRHECVKSVARLVQSK